MLAPFTVIVSGEDTTKAIAEHGLIHTGEREFWNGENRQDSQLFPLYHNTVRLPSTFSRPYPPPYRRKDNFHYSDALTHSSCWLELMTCIREHAKRRSLRTCTVRGDGSSTSSQHQGGHAHSLLKQSRGRPYVSLSAWGRSVSNSQGFEFKLCRSPRRRCRCLLTEESVRGNCYG